MPMDAQVSDPIFSSQRPEGLQRVVVHDFAGHPFQVQLSRELAKRGYDVLHLYGASNMTPKGAMAPLPDDPETLSIASLTGPGAYQRYSFVRRWRYEVAYGKRLVERIVDWSPDLVISCNTPLDAQGMLLDRCRSLKLPLIFWVQDLVGVAANKILRRKIPVLGRFVGQYYLSLEQRIARQSNAIVAITEDFLPLLRDWKVAPEKLFAIENWAPLAEIPALPQDNDWARSQGLAGKTCIVYTGSMGLKHNPELICRLAEGFREQPEVAIVVVSEGLGADWLAEQKAARGLDNLTLLGFQPYDRLPEVLATAAVLVAVLEPDAGIFSVPSKVLSYLCAGRALLGAIPQENLAARILERNRAGLVADPADLEGFLGTAKRLIEDPALRNDLAGNARKYAESAFDIEAITTRFETVMRRAYG